MNSFLKELLNVDLVSITFIHDYLQVGFSNEMGLTINNKFEWSTQDYRSIIGSKVKEINEVDDRITIKFSNGEYLAVGFRKEDFVGPEGMLLHRNGSPSPVIWDESYVAHE